MRESLRHHVLDKATSGVSPMIGITPSRYFPWLLLLVALFLLRVVGQFVQLLWPQAFLPPFEAWDSGALPYWAILCAQIVILALLIQVLIRVRRNAIRPSRKKSLSYFVFGWVYLAVMVFRLVAGQTFLAEQTWFAPTLPTLFHFVLAAFLLLLGRIHHVGSQQEDPRRNRRLVELR